MYCNQQGTDGEIEILYLKYVWPYGDASEHLLELLDTGWLVETEKGFLIPDWEDKGQSPASQVLANKEKNRLRQQKSRESRKTSQSGPVTRDVMRDVGQDRRGQDTTGQDRTGQLRRKLPGRKSDNQEPQPDGRERGQLCLLMADHRYP